jgi:hypothetical protein
VNCSMVSRYLLSSSSGNSDETCERARAGVTSR